MTKVIIQVAHIVAPRLSDNHISSILIEKAQTLRRTVPTRSVLANCPFRMNNMTSKMSLSRVVSEPFKTQDSPAGNEAYRIEINRCMQTIVCYTEETYRICKAFHAVTKQVSTDRERISLSLRNERLGNMEKDSRKKE